ncbi:MAG: hypothetical protein AAGG68_13695 [Bacteroidota bacterium]
MRANYVKYVVNRYETTNFMRSKLQKFTTFTNGLLPHETQYLLAHQSFADQERLSILKRIDFNCQNIEQFTPYDEKVDKRKYSHLKNWIEKRLQLIDVDVQYEWISELDRKIMTDSISPEDELQLLKFIKNYRHPIFFFTHFYELVQNYRQFLLIRIRYNDHEKTDRFLRTYEAQYLHSKSIYEKLHVATLDIVEQYKAATAESRQWESWLTDIFYDEQLDGLNRYQALIRLNFIGFNYRKFDQLLEKFNYLDQQFSAGQYYSKRLLLNYYGNRLLLHSKSRDLDRAAYYGFLSIRSKNHDYLYYLNNLCAVLLRQKKHQKALNIMHQGASAAKKTKNLHAKIGYIAFYIECLIACGNYKNAERYAQSYLNVYSKEIKEYRWHLFFSAYLKSILQQYKYRDLLSVIQQNHLLEKDKTYQKKATYLPTIPWFHAVASYQEGIIHKSILQEKLNQFKQVEDHKQYLLNDLLELVKKHI